jgi:hypothetical protein
MAAGRKYLFSNTMARSYLSMDADRGEKLISAVVSVLFFIIRSVNPLGTADFSSEGNHFGYIDAERAIAPGAEHASVKDDIPDFLQGLPVNLALLFIQLSNGIDEFMGRHVTGITATGGE